MVGLLGISFVYTIEIVDKEDVGVCIFWKWVFHLIVGLTFRFML